MKADSAAAVFVSEISGWWVCCSFKEEHHRQASVGPAASLVG